SVRRMSKRGMDRSVLRLDTATCSEKPRRQMSSGLYCYPFARMASRSLQALSRLFGKAQIGVLTHVELGLDESKLLRQVDVGLERLEIGKHVRISIVVFFGKEPVESLRRCFHHFGSDTGHFCVVLGIGEPPFDPQH